MAAEKGIGALSGKGGAICDEIEKRLARGEYAFGQEISVVELVKEFGASRAPVMSALNYLRAEGYLVIIPQVGCKVIEPTVSQIEDFFVVYGRVEGAMAAMAAQRHLPEQARRLRRLQEDVKIARPKRNEVISEEFVDLVGQFHAMIHKMAHSELESTRAARYWRMSEFFLFNGNRMSVLGGNSLEIADLQRAEIVEAIIARDIERSCSLMDEHMRGKPLRVGVSAGHLIDSAG